MRAKQAEISKLQDKLASALAEGNARTRECHALQFEIGKLKRARNDKAHLVFHSMGEKDFLYWLGFDKKHFEDQWQWTKDLLLKIDFRSQARKDVKRPRVETEDIVNTLKEYLCWFFVALYKKGADDLYL